MNGRTILAASKQRGFTLLELMLVMLILSVIVGAVFLQMRTAQQRLSAEEIKLDDFGQARDFVDQFFRDINQIGTPNIRMFDTVSGTFTPALSPQTPTCVVTPSSCTYSWANPYINDSHFAMGLTHIDNAEIWFEGSVSGTGTVQSVIYKINGSGTCSLCMQRSQSDKTNGDPITTATGNENWGTEVNDIQTATVFKFYQYDGTLITIPAGGLDYKSSAANAGILASVKTIQINLTIRNNAVMDQQTKQPIETSFEGEVSLNNCSMAAAGQPMSCQ